MVQVRCPECGYLQTLSEERFMAVTEDFLPCPHCDAKVPKAWTPAAGEAVPEETRHKMLAFSRRILSGRNVAREVVYALESLVRHYGGTEDTDKALGVGHTIFREYTKAEEYLERARKRTPEDKLVLHSLLEVLLGTEKFAEAVQVGNFLLDACGSRMDDGDVARLALALNALDRAEEAKSLLERFDDLDSGNPLVKQARKAINRTPGRGLRGLFGENGSIQRLFGAARKDTLSGLTRRAGGFMRARSQDSPEADSPSADVGEGVDQKAAQPAVDKLQRLPILLEYWIYTRHPQIPRWEDIQEKLAGQLSEREPRQRTFEFLEALVETDGLAIEYIVREDAEDLFDYPQDMIPCNSKKFGEEDRAALLEATMIVRIRLSLSESSNLGYLSFMMRFVEAVRLCTGGIVQDAVSHHLWGAQSWQAAARKADRMALESHVLIETLDEGQGVWVHTHGMQKFGLPDLEIEGIPAESAFAARKLTAKVCEALTFPTEQELDLKAPLKISKWSVLVALEFRPEDEEGHFPAGSLKLSPFPANGDRRDPDAPKQALALIGARPSVAAADKPEADQKPASAEPSPSPENGKAELRGKLLAAHRKAREDLPQFRKSFHENRTVEDVIHAVKVAFAVHGGTYEWMWVSVGEWRSGSMVGRLENTPVLRRDLRKGITVRISEGEVFDWVVARAGEVEHGAYTEGIMS